MSFDSLMGKVDWKELAAQKYVIVDHRATIKTKKLYEALSGIIHLIDALQDEARAQGLIVSEEEQTGVK